MAVTQSLFSQLVSKKRSYEKIKRITVIVLRVCNGFLSRHEKRKVKNSENDIPTYEEFNLAADMLVLSSQEVELKLFNKEKYKSLFAFHQKEVKLRWPLQQIGGSFGSRSFTIVKIQGRGEKALLSTFDGEKELDPGSPGLVLLESKNVLAVAIM